MFLGHRLLYGLLFFIALFFLRSAEAALHFPKGTHDVYIADNQKIDHIALKKVAFMVEQSITQGYYPGAVIIASHQGEIIYRGVFGNRRIVPNVAPMQLDTLFDIASLTKVVATAPAIMQLVEEGKLDLDAPVASYWPAFGSHNKNAVTVRQLLTHTSGLPAILPRSKEQKKLDLVYSWHTKEAGLQQILLLEPKIAPGTKYIYSDINYIILGHLVEIISGEPLQDYVTDHLFTKLNMKNTLYTPPVQLNNQIAPTEIVDNQLRWGQVHDPSAYAMGGIAGNAGLFSTAEDLGLYAQNLLDAVKAAYLTSSKEKPPSILKPATVLSMTTPQQNLHHSIKRGLGFEIEASSILHTDPAPMYSFSHTGWTGTSLWIDPKKDSWIIILTSRTHPQRRLHNQLLADRKKIKALILESIRDKTITTTND